MSKKILIGIIILVLIASLFFFFKSNPEFLQKTGETERQDKGEVEYVLLEEEDDPLMRGALWGMSLEEVKEVEDSNYSHLYLEGSEFLTYEDVSYFNEEYLLTYLFDKKDRLVGVLYELETDNPSRQKLAQKHQKVANELNTMYESKMHFEDFKWHDQKRRIYDHNLWNSDILNGNLEMISAWRGKEHTLYLNTTAQPLFDFLFSKRLDIDFGNQMLLLTKNETKELDKLTAITPPLTEERKEAKVRAFDLFDNSIHEDNLGKMLAQEVEQKLRILRFSKSEQYFVIANNTDEILDLSGWYIRTQNKGLTFYFDDEFEIKPDEHILIHGKDGRDAYKSGVSRVTIYNHLDQEIESAK